MKRRTSHRRRAQLWSKHGVEPMIESAAPLRVVEETPAYWRAVFDYPPFNMVDATIFEGLQDRFAREHATGSTRSRGRSASRRGRYGTPPASGRPRPRARSHSRCE